MKNKIVIWGEENDKKVLLALELNERDNKVMIYVFSEDMATEEFFKSLMDEWKSNKEVVFPEGHKTIERQLSITEGLLPDEIKTSKTDILTRAQAEWHFNVLSSKLFQMYRSELDEYKDKVDALTEYSEDVWNEMKGFWDKVQGQVRERNMFRDHAATLKERTNNLFDKLKVLRKEMKKELEQKSSALADSFNSELDAIEQKVEKGLALNPVFEELKTLQGKFFKGEFTRKDKNSLWKRIDGIFKRVKEARFGDKGGKGNKSGSRLQSRYDGLLKAINRMQNSINYDKKDVDFQNNKISTTDGQLEMQIRQAKLVMIQERLNSKQAKLEDMLKTKTDLEKQLEKEKRRKEQEALNIEKEKVKESVKQKIAQEIKASKQDLKEQEEKLSKAAAEIQESKRPKQKKDTPTVSEEKKQTEETIEPDEDSKLEEVMDKIGDTVSQVVEDVTDTVSAILEVAEEKIDDFVGKLKDEEE